MTTAGGFQAQVAHSSLLLYHIAMERAAMCLDNLTEQRPCSSNQRKACGKLLHAQSIRVVLKTLVHAHSGVMEPLAMQYAWKQ